MSSSASPVYKPTNGTDEKRPVTGFDNSKVQEMIRALFSNDYAVVQQALSYFQSYLSQGCDPNIRTSDTGIPLIFCALYMAISQKPYALDFLKCFRGTQVNLNATFNYNFKPATGMRFGASWDCSDDYSDYNWPEVDIESATEYKFVPLQQIENKAISNHEDQRLVKMNEEALWINKLFTKLASSNHTNPRQRAESIYRALVRICPGLPGEELQWLAGHPSRLVRMIGLVLTRDECQFSYDPERKINYVNLCRETKTPLILQVIKLMGYSHIHEETKKTLRLIFDELLTYPEERLDLKVKDPVTGGNLLHIIMASDSSPDHLIHVVNKLFEKNLYDLLFQNDGTSLYSTTPISLGEKFLKRQWNEAAYVLLNYLLYKEQKHKNKTAVDRDVKMSSKEDEENVQRIKRDLLPSGEMKYLMLRAAGKKDEKFLIDGFKKGFSVLRNPFYNPPSDDFFGTSLAAYQLDYLHNFKSFSPAITALVYQCALPELLKEYIESVQLDKTTAKIQVKFKNKNLLPEYGDAIFNFLRGIDLPSRLKTGFIDNDSKKFTGVICKYSDVLPPKQHEAYAVKELSSYLGNTMENSSCVIAIDDKYLDDKEEIFSHFCKELLRLAPTIRIEVDSTELNNKLPKVLSKIISPVSFTKDEIAIISGRYIGFFNDILKIYLKSGDKYYYDVMEYLLKEGINFDSFPNSDVPPLQNLMRELNTVMSESGVKRYGFKQEAYELTFQLLLKYKMIIGINRKQDRMPSEPEMKTDGDVKASDTACKVIAQSPQSRSDYFDLLRKNSNHPVYELLISFLDSKSEEFKKIMLSSLLKCKETELHGVDPITKASLLHLVALSQQSSDRDLITLLLRRGIGCCFMVKDKFGLTPVMMSKAFGADPGILAKLEIEEKREVANISTIKSMIECFESFELSQSLNQTDEKQLPQSNSQNNQAIVGIIKKGSSFLPRDLYPIISQYLSNSIAFVDINAGDKIALLAYKKQNQADLINGIMQEIRLLDNYELAKKQDLMGTVEYYLENGGDPNIRNAMSVPLIFIAVHILIDGGDALKFLRYFRQTAVDVNATFDYDFEDSDYNWEETDIDRRIDLNNPNEKLRDYFDWLKEVCDKANNFIPRERARFIYNQFSRLSFLSDRERRWLAGHPSRFVRILAAIESATAPYQSYVSIYKSVRNPLILQVAKMMVSAKVKEQMKISLCRMFNELLDHHQVNLDAKDHFMGGNILHILAASSLSTELQIQMINKLFEKNVGHLLFEVCEGEGKIGKNATPLMIANEFKADAKIINQLEIRELYYTIETLKLVMKYCFTKDISPTQSDDKQLASDAKNSGEIKQYNKLYSIFGGYISYKFAVSGADTSVQKYVP